MLTETQINSIANEFIKFRELFAKISLDELASQSGISKEIFERIEQGRFSEVSLAAFLEVCCFCGKLDRIRQAVNCDENIDRRRIWEFMLTDSGESLNDHPFVWKDNIE